MAYFGMRGTGDWAANERPTNWREMILRLYPNGQAPLTAMLSKMRSESVDDPLFNWWTKSFPNQAGDIIGIYTNSGLTNAYVSGGASGDMVYVNVTEAIASEFRAGHEVIMRDASDLTVDVVGKVTLRIDDGSSSFLKVKLLEADDNSTAGDLSNADRILVTGNINAEGAGMPDAISYDPTQWFNYTQIIRTSLEITGTAIETKLRRRPQAYAELKREALELHAIEKEKAFLWGVPSVSIGDNGKEERTTLGIIPAIRGGYTGAGGTAGTVSNYVTDTDYSGQSWLTGGEDWLETQLETIFRYGKRQKLALCGSGAQMAINKLVKNGGDFSFGPKTSVYGIEISSWHTVLGTINFLSHPLFCQEETNRNIMVIIEPENLIYKYITNRDTHFISDKIGTQNTGYTRRDGKKEEFLTECGLEYHHPVSWAYLTGFGQANTA